MRVLKLIFVALVVSFSAVSESAVPAFEKGDRVTFIGDSITHGGDYHANIYLFYATRFPMQPFSVYNCGVSGDTAPGANGRFASDIAVHKPSVATIMLGMNDAWGECFGEGESTVAMLDCQERSYGTYTKEMDILATKLADMDCSVIFIKPSIYDQTAKIEQGNLVGKNDQLGRFGVFIDTLAAKHGNQVVDFYSIMGELNKKLQAEDPGATIVGRDRVHPGAPGHFVMSYAFLKAQGMPSLVSAIEVDAAAGNVLRQENCSIDGEVTLSSDRVAFTCMEEALPFPVVGEQIDALQWVPFQEELNQQVFKVRGLKTGSYVLKIDDAEVGTWSATELSEGINLSGNTLTPQYEQAREVKAFNHRRLAAVSKLRTIALVRYTMLNQLNPPVPEDDLKALEIALSAHVETQQGKPWYYYLRDQVKAYLEAVPDEKALEALGEAMMNEIWTVNQPKAHRWTLVAVDSDAR
jgi:lysophospholipase L1-like esterase